MEAVGRGAGGATLRPFRVRSTEHATGELYGSQYFCGYSGPVIIHIAYSI